MKKMLWLFVLPILWSSSGCYEDCDYTCLESPLQITYADGTNKVALVDFPYRSIVNVESNQEVWKLEFDPAEDSLQLFQFDFISLPVHPDKPQSTFHFLDEEGNVLANIKVSLDYELMYYDACRGYALAMQTDPIIESSFDNLETGTNYSLNDPFSCPPNLFLEL